MTKFETTKEKLLELASTSGEAKNILTRLFPEAFSANNENIITTFPEASESSFYINGIWAGSLFYLEAEGSGFDGSKKSGHKSSAFLCNAHGDWYDQDGNKVSGYLYYKPKK
jgi:hypothetical protein